jgi:hypothetical protein
MKPADPQRRIMEVGTSTDRDKTDSSRSRSGDNSEQERNSKNERTTLC